MVLTTARTILRPFRLEDAPDLYAFSRDRRVADAAFEVHRHYMDVQVDIDGAERFMVTPGEMVEEGPFDEASDGGLCQPAPGNTDLIEGELGHGRFVIFMVGEPHMPTLALPEEGPRPVRKVCFKVLDDAHWDA